MPICQGCSASYDESLIICPYCGRAKPKPQKIDIEVSLSPKQSAQDCPKCNNDTHTQKVSSIYASGTSTGIGYSEGSGTSNHYQTYDAKRIGTSYSSTSSYSLLINQNQLAGKLIPPTPPERKQSGDLIIYVVMIIAAIPTCGIVFGLTNLPNTSPFGTLVALVVLEILFVAGLFLLLENLTEPETKRNEKEFQEKMTAYKKAKYVWEHLYYCYKHDIVFLEGRKDYAEVENSLQACYIWGKDLDESVIDESN